MGRVRLGPLWGFVMHSQLVWSLVAGLVVGFVIGWWCRSLVMLRVYGQPFEVDEEEADEWDD